jgi:hypothetical protein
MAPIDAWRTLARTVWRPSSPALTAESVTSLGAIARALIERSVPAARRGANWTAMQVARVQRLIG